MTDIVERLRDLADCDARSGEPLGECMREAADEIERLRKDIDPQCGGSMELKDARSQ